VNSNCSETYIKLNL